MCGSIGLVLLAHDQHDDVFYLVVTGTILDLVDGGVARLLKVNSKIGELLDTLADMVTFGVLPAVYFANELTTGTAWHWLMIFSIYPVASAVRLARFSIDVKKSDRFIGLPTPAAAILTASLIHYDYFIITETISYAPVVLLMISVAMILPMNMLTLKFSNFSFPGNEWKYALIAGCALLFIFFGERSIPGFIIIYIVISLLNNLAGYIILNQKTNEF